MNFWQVGVCHRSVTYFKEDYSFVYRRTDIFWEHDILWGRTFALDACARARTSGNVTHSAATYRINWFISPPYVARARQMTLSRGGLIAKGFTM
jgi:hypothetical protein